MTTLTVGWALFWPVPTEVVGRGVLVVPGGASVLDARAEGQILELPLRPGARVRRGQLLLRLYLPTLDQELRRQQRDLAELRRINADLDRRDARRLDSGRKLLDTSLDRLAQDRRRYRELSGVYDQKVADFRHLASRAVVAPLSQEVLASEDRSVQLQATLAELPIREKQAIDQWEALRLEIATQARQRQYRIDDARRALQVTRTRLDYLSTLRAVRDGRLLDLQVVLGQTVKPGQRLGTLGGSNTPGLQAVAYFAPADARRLPRGLAMEVVPDWKERGRFGGIRGRVESVNLLPASREDVSTTTGNPQLAEALTRSGPVMRSLIRLEPAAAASPGRTDRDAAGRYRWTLSRGSSVFPIDRKSTRLNSSHSSVSRMPSSA